MVLDRYAIMGFEAHRDPWIRNITQAGDKSLNQGSFFRLFCQFGEASDVPITKYFYAISFAAVFPSLINARIYGKKRHLGIVTHHLFDFSRQGLLSGADFGP